MVVGTGLLPFFLCFNEHRKLSHSVKDIDRTQEYEQFMQQLREFHERKGTPFQPEPILGGQKLDLLKIYKTVISAGGYKKVTENRGWKQVGDPFDFPPTCTNSAYILKLVYTKNLLGWEEENLWKRPWNPPKEQLEQKSGSHSSLTNSAATKPRDAARKTATAFTYQNPQPIPPFPTAAANVQPVYTQPHVYVDDAFQHRILLALTSTLPNEVDWAFNVLIRFSYTAESFSLESMPTLIDRLVEFATPFFRDRFPRSTTKKINDASTDVEVETLFSSKKNQIDFERVLQVFHIIRNFSFTDINIRPLAHHQKLRELLMAGLALPPDSQYAELSRQCLDVMESISPQVVLVSANDPYLIAMGSLMFTNDRALILGALRSLTRVAVSEVNETVLAVGNRDLIRRTGQLLLVDDEELVAATLEYLYQYSSLHGNFTNELVKHHPGNVVGLLTGYLSYKSALAPRSVPLNETIHAIPATQLAPQKSAPQAPPTIPDLTDYLNLDEPYRCLGWLKEMLLSGGPEDQLPFKELFGKYNSLFGTQKPLAIKEFYTVLKIAFPQPASVEEAVKTNSTAMDDLVLGNVKYAPLRSSDSIECKWADCDQTFESEDGLQTHLVSVHLAKADEKLDEAAKEEGAEDSESGYECQWMGCTQKGFKYKSWVFSHARTHFPSKVTKPTKRRIHSSFSIDRIPVDDADVSGVPLTAALLLRNLAKYKECHPLFLPYQLELAQLSIQRPKLAKYTLSVLEELQINS